MLGALSIIIGVAAIAFYKFTPSILEPTLWKNPPPLLKFERPTAPNQLLQHAAKSAAHLHGPESTAFDPVDGTAYVSFGDGTVRSFTKEGVLLDTVFFTGGVGNLGGPNGVNERSAELRQWCATESNEGRLAWSYEGEWKCGRPLGLRFRLEEGVRYLYIADAYHGIFKLDLDHATATHLVSPTTPIQSHAGMDPKALLAPSFYNDLDVSIDGTIAFSDSSYRYSRSQNRPEILDGAPRGRLFQYDPLTAQLSVVLCGLHFPNGVQFLPPRTVAYTETVVVTDTDESGAEVERTEERVFETTAQEEVIVNELTRFRVLKVNTATALQNREQLTGSCLEEGGLYQALARADRPAGTRYAKSGVDVFIDNVPGLADNVRADPKTSSGGGSYYFFGLGSKATQPFSLLHVVLQSNLLREIIGRVLPMKLVEKLVPRYGLVLVSDAAGNLVGSLHDPSGAVSMISQADRHPLTGDLWLGSHSEPLAILPARYVPSEW